MLIGPTGSEGTLWWTSYLYGVRSDVSVWSKVLECWKKKTHFLSFPISHHHVRSSIFRQLLIQYQSNCALFSPSSPWALIFFISCAEWAFLCIPYNISASCFLPLPICPVIWKKTNKKKYFILQPGAASPKQLTVWVYQSWSPLVVCEGCECVEVLELLGVSRSSKPQLQSVIIK